MAQMIASLTQFSRLSPFCSKVIHSVPDQLSLLQYLNDSYDLGLVDLYLYRNMIGAVYFLRRQGKRYVYKLYREADSAAAIRCAEITPMPARCWNATLHDFSLTGSAQVSAYGLSSQVFYVKLLSAADCSQLVLLRPVYCCNTGAMKVLVLRTRTVSTWYFFHLEVRELNRSATKNLVLAALFLALGLLMPFLTGQIPNLGSKLLPMHLPVLICGFVCGWPLGLVVGLITPVFRSLIFGMPPLFPTAVVMSFELAAYGFATGWFRRLFPKKSVFVYPTLILSMLLGRVVWGTASYVILGFADRAFGWKAFVAGAFVNALPGIILQLVVIPVVIIALDNARLIDNNG
ncbi:MAG: ECF transporter S component [Clostridia bacterium]|nr:ECF transporter S component [Clostridia bacterium]